MSHTIRDGLTIHICNGHFLGFLTVYSCIPGEAEKAVLGGMKFLRFCPFFSGEVLGIRGGTQT